MMPQKSLEVYLPPKIPLKIQSMLIDKTYRFRGSPQKCF